MAWGKGLEIVQDRHVADEMVGDARVSTVFLGRDHRFGDIGPPLLFETLVFDRPLADEMDRYSKWEEAEKIWKEIIGRSREFIYYPYEELAKYYEHRLKNYQKAEMIVEEAINIGENIFTEKMLQHRLNRIKSKLLYHPQKLTQGKP